jgi:hypothetical protein
LAKTCRSCNWWQEGRKEESMRIGERRSVVSGSGCFPNWPRRCVFCALNALRRSTLERARPLDWHGLTAQIDWICPSLPFYISGDLNCMRYSTSFK